jgi:hypothetical protein
MASLASAEGRARVALLLGATALGWAAQWWLVANDAGPLCGVSAEALLSLGGLIAMWSLMVVTMMLPVTLVRTRGGEANGFSLGYLATALIPAWGAALLEWIFRGLSLMPNGVPPNGMQFVLVGLAMLGLLRDAKTHHPISGSGKRAGIVAGRAHFGASTAMVALQLAFGSMDLLLMLVLALWMLAAAAIPNRPLARLLSPA